VVLASDDRHTVISNLGWADGGSLWVYRDQVGRAQSTKLGSAKHLSLHRGVDNHVAITHHHDGDIRITIHRFPEIENVLAEVVLKSGEAEWSGSGEVWRHVPRHYTGYMKTKYWDAYALITLEGDTQTAALHEFTWFDDHYDKGYQGIVGVSEIPHTDRVLVSVQRSSMLIIYDPAARTKVGEVKLAGRAGNPQLYFRRNARELWASDYDTMVRLDWSTWRITDSRRLQSAVVGSAQFIGSFTMDAAEQICVVARPFRGDVVGIDTRTFKPTLFSDVGRQPLEATILDEKRIIARDWKTGSTLQGQLRRKWWSA
jgi:hypothetical protein